MPLRGWRRVGIMMKSTRCGREDELYSANAHPLCHARTYALALSLIPTNRRWRDQTRSFLNHLSHCEVGSGMIQTVLGIADVRAS